MQQEIERDLKTALLGGDKALAETLRGLKSALQYEAHAGNLNLEDFTDEQIQKVLAREAKKRQEAADLYEKVGEKERSTKELEEKTAICKYLPQQMSEDELTKIVAEEVEKVKQPSLKEMGSIIGAVRARTEGRADGSAIARLVKQSLESK